MEYVSPCGIKAIPENSHVQARKVAIKLKTPSVLTQKENAGNALGGRALISRDIFSHPDSGVGQACGVELKVTKYDITENSNQKTSQPEQKNGKLPGNLIVETIADLNSITSCDNTVHCDPSQHRIDPRLSSSHDSFKDRMNIKNINQNSHTKELHSSSTSLSQLSRNYSISPPRTKDDENFKLAESARKKGLTRGDLTKSDMTQDLYNQELALYIPEFESAALCEKYHKKKIVSAPLMPIIDVTKTVNYSSVAPVPFPRTTGLHHLEGVNDANNQDHERFLIRPAHNTSTDSANSIEYEDVFSNSVVDTPKIRSHMKSSDITPAIFVSGIDEHVMGRSSVIKRSSRHSQPLNLQDMTKYFIKHKPSTSDEEDRLLIDKLKPGSNVVTEKHVGVHSKNVCDNLSRIIDLGEKCQNIEYRSSSPSGSQSTPISKLPIRINRDICKSQSFNRPRLSPVLSSETIYRLRDRNSEVYDFPRLLSTHKELENYNDGQNLKSSLYHENFTKIPTNFVIHHSKSLEPIPTTKLPQISPENRPVSLGKVSGNYEFEEDYSVPRDQAAQKALRLILMNSSAGMK